ncbi:MAG TPA: hypothetical protein VIN34_08075 [Candidatus Limnocylindria bacterium]|jgi:hypothetical protein
MRFLIAIAVAAVLDQVVFLRIADWIGVAALLALAYLSFASAGAGFFAGRRPALAGALAVFAAALLSGVVSYLTRSSYANDLGSLLQYELQLVVSVVPYAVAGALSGLLGGRLRAGLSGIPAGR